MFRTIVKHLAFMLVLVPSFYSSANNFELKFEKYRQLTAQCALYSYEFASDNPADIASQAQNLKLFEDTSDLGIIFQNVFYSVCSDRAAHEIDDFDKRFKPIRYPKETDWEQIRNEKPNYYPIFFSIYIVNTESLAIRTKVKMLRDEVIRMLQMENIESAAIVKFNLGFILSDYDPVSAIEEIRYAIPHLPLLNKEHPILTYFEKGYAHYFLARLYLMSEFWEQVAFHGEQALSLAEGSKLSPWHYANQIEAHVALGHYEKASKLIKASNQSASGKNDWQKAWAFQQEINLLISRGEKNDLIRIKRLADDSKDIRVKEPYDAIVLKSIEIAGHAVQLDSNDFELAVSEYLIEHQNLAALLSVSDEPQLFKFRFLSRLYALRNDFEKAYQYELLHEQFKRDLNVSHYISSVENDQDWLGREAKYLAYQQEKNRQEKKALIVQTEKLKYAFSSFVVLILCVVLVWFWQRNRSSYENVNTDRLTGAMTLTAMDNLLRTNTISWQKGYLALIDFDNFGEINKNYGHRSGDKILKDFVKIIQQRLNAQDKLFRMSGKRFALFLNGPEKLDAIEFISQIRNVVEHNDWGLSEYMTKVSFSASVIEIAQSDDVDEALALSESLLLKAKTLGKGRTVQAA